MDWIIEKFGIKEKKRIVLESEVLKEKRILDKLNLNNVENSQSNQAGFLFFEFVFKRWWVI